MSVLCHRTLPAPSWLASEVASDHFTSPRTDELLALCPASNHLPPEDQLHPPTREQLLNTHRASESIVSRCTNPVGRCCHCERKLCCVVVVVVVVVALLFVGVRNGGADTEREVSGEASEWLVGWWLVGWLGAQRERGGGQRRWLGAAEGEAERGSKGTACVGKREKTDSASDCVRVGSERVSERVSE